MKDTTLAKSGLGNPKRGFDIWECIYWAPEVYVLESSLSVKKLEQQPLGTRSSSDAQRSLMETMCLFVVGCQWHRSGMKLSLTLQDGLNCCVPAYMASAAPSCTYFGAPSVTGSAIAPSLPLLLVFFLAAELPTVCWQSAAKQPPCVGLLSPPAVPASPLQHPINSLRLFKSGSFARLCFLPGSSCSLSCPFVYFQGHWACARWVSNEQGWGARSMTLLRKELWFCMSPRCWVPTTSWK